MNKPFNMFTKNLLEENFRKKIVCRPWRDRSNIVMMDWPSFIMKELVIR